ncbi:MAG TPA: hypothetical protein VII06_38630 [Chloroflexota bacterium]
MSSSARAAVSGRPLWIGAPVLGALLALVVALSQPTSALATIAFLANLGTAGSGVPVTSLTINSAAAVPAGSTIIVSIAYSNGTNVPSPVTCSDGAGNAYTTSISATRATEEVITVICFAQVANPLALAAPITINFGGAAVASPDASATAFTGLTGTVDQQVTDNNISQTPATLPSGVTTQANELLMGAIGTGGINNVFTPGTNNTANNCATSGTPTYTALPSSASGPTVSIFPQFCIVSAQASYEATGTLNNRDNWAALLVTFAAAPNTPTPTNTPTNTSTATNTPTNTPTATATNTATATATRTSTPTSTATASSTATATATSTATPLGGATATATSTATPLGGATATATTAATSTATAPPCIGIGAICHADLTVVPNANSLTGVQFVWAAGPLLAGPCVPSDKTNCVETTNTGSFTVRATLVGLLPGDVPLIRIPVVNAAGLFLGTRDVACPAAGADSRSVCPGLVGEAGIFPQLGGIVQVLLTRPTPPVPVVPVPPTPVQIIPIVLPPPPPPPPPLPLLPPPMLLLPPPPLPMPEVPVVPEADSGALLLAALGALAAWAGLRRRSR